MAVTRESLYQQVWSEPATIVSARHGVSANYLARVCQHLNIPRPPRGYWAKLQAGQSPDPIPLPPAPPGDVLSWENGQSAPRSTRGETGTTLIGKVSRPERSTRHQLVTAVREYFEAGRLSDVGYLRPLKRNLVDIFVSKPALAY